MKQKKKAVRNPTVEEMEAAGLRPMDYAAVFPVYSKTYLYGWGPKGNGWEAYKAMCRDFAKLEKRK